MTKRALLIGINYIGTSSELNGCIIDVKNIKKLLMSNFKYLEQNIVMMNDADGLMPTKQNMLDEINKIVALTKPGDVLFMHYSGHGSQVYDKNGDERYNNETRYYDDVLCPCDYPKAGFIVDDVLKEIIVNKIPKGAKLRAFFDCCHSGTVLDLSYILRNNIFTYVEAAGKLSDDCLMISGCKDNQTSADAFIDQQYSGALTWALMKVLVNVGTVNTTWQTLLTTTQHYLKDSGYTQIPVLTLGNKSLAKLYIDL